MDGTHFHDAVSGQNTAAGLHASQGGSISVNFHTPNTSGADADACRRSLFLTDPLEDKKALKRKKGDRAAGTFEWILDTKELTTWLGSGTKEHQESHVLWLYGNPGTGKSTMAIFLTERLLQDFVAVDEKTLAVFFCDSSFNERRTATSIVRGLLYQLIRQHPPLICHILPKYRDRREKLFESFDALWEILMDIVADPNIGHTYCIIDALDECDRQDQEILLQQLQETFQDPSSQKKLRILITSRPYPEISEYLEEFANKDLASFPHMAQDINQFIKQKTEHLAKKKRYTEKTKREIGNILREKAEGTFLWIGLASKELESVPSKDAIQILQNMPKGLHALYKRLLDAVEEIQENDITQVQRILSFVAVCLRPLSVLELSEVCQLHQDEEDIDTRIQFTRDQISSCRLIIVIQDEQVLLLHQSVKDFLVGAEAGHLINELEAHAQLACRCIDILIEKSHDEDFAPTTLTYYAANEWFNHARMAQSKFEVKSAQIKFFGVVSPWRAHWQRAYRWRVFDQLGRGPTIIPLRFSILHMAACWGIVALTQREYSSAGKLVDLVDIVNDFGNTPLDDAISWEQMDLIPILLNLGSQVTTRALCYAAESLFRGLEVLTLLLDRQGDQVTITKEVLVTAAKNPIWGVELMTLLLDRQGDQITLTTKVLEAAAKNPSCGVELITLLVDRHGDQITEEELVAVVRSNHRILELRTRLLDRQEIKSLSWKTIRGGNHTTTSQPIRRPNHYYRRDRVRRLGKRALWSRGHTTTS